MTNFSGQSVMILGASSDLGRALARRYGQAGSDLRLVARDPQALAMDAEDLRLRYNIAVEVARLDVLDFDDARTFAATLNPLPDTIICTVGLMEHQAGLEAEPQVIGANFIGPALVLDLIGCHMAQRGSGSIIAFSSVAGDRGKARNLFYGAAKAGFTAFLSGLRNRLFGSGVLVMTVKPGFCLTRMTEGMRLPPLLTATPEDVAKAVFRAHGRGQDVLYVRPVWRLISMIISLMPEALFKRLRL